MKNVIIFFLSFLSICFTSFCNGADINGTITIDGIEREYILHLPKSYAGDIPLPLVMVFHGGGGTAKQIKSHTGFNKLADKENFIVVYPNSVDKNWSDGRIGDKLPMERDDVKFISNLIDTLSAKYRIDTKRVFSTGISNGGFFSFYLALKLSGKILAVAPVTANIPENLKDSYKPEYPVSLLLINGTDDPLVKYEGGFVGFKDDEGGRGRSVSTDSTIKIWLENNKCATGSSVEKIPDVNKKDDCSASRYTYTGCVDNTEVVLVKITGGGHTWPGASQYLPKFIVGKVCRDFRATEVIWDFFKNSKSR
ncbi:Oxidized polyvinyl alcohol hydrolase [uncultured bacterium]|nr:Oxidized polyvinyl alcohol hydrolase [uncultured bacterium]